MSGDYKWDIQVRAEELAMDRYGIEFYELPEHRRDSIYREAMTDWSEGLAAKADWLNDCAKEGKL